MHLSISHFAAAVSVLFLLLSGCASSSDTGSPTLDLQIEQMPDAGLSVEDRGFLSVAYQMTVRNRSTDPITLSSIEMKTIRNSRYTLRNESVALTETIEAGQEAVVTFGMWKTPGETRSTMRELVWVSGVVAFHNAKGNFKRPFTQSFREP